MMTGQQYKDSLKDGRKVYYQGRLIEDFATEPALAVPMEVAAEGYDKYYSAEPGALNPVIAAPRSVEELRNKIPELLEMDLLLNVTYQSIMTLIVAASRIESTAPQFVPRINAYIKKAREDDIRITECVTDAKGDRSRAPAKQDDPDAYVRVVDRRPDGVVVRGAKMHISAAALGHHLMVMPTKTMKPGEEDYAIACAIPVNAPGVYITNTTYHPSGGDGRDYPVSSKKSVPDSTGKRLSAPAA